MSPQRFALPLAALLLAASLTGIASAQSNPPPGKDDANETGDENEFGTLKAPYQLMINGQELAVESRVVLKEMYDGEATYFMFGVDTQESPALYASLDSVTTTDGTELAVFDKQQENGVEQWFVDVDDMPGVGTEIVIRFTVGASQEGFFQVGSMVLPFDRHWEQITMANGDQAKLYGATQIGVNDATRDGGGVKFRSPVGDEESALPVPGAGAFAAVIAVGLAALALAGRRRS